MKASSSENDFYWLNKVLHDTQSAANLAAFKRDRQGFLKDYRLSQAASRAVCDNDIAAMYAAGANPYLLVYHSRLVGRPDNEIVESLHAIKSGEARGAA